MTADEKRAIAREAHHLRSGAGGNPVALATAHKLIEMVGGEAAATFPREFKDDRELRVGRRGSFPQAPAIRD